MYGEVEEIHLGSVTDSHVLAGLFQVVQTWARVKGLRVAFTLVLKTHSGSLIEVQEEKVGWWVALAGGGTMGSRRWGERMSVWRQSPLWLEWKTAREETADRGWSEDGVRN